MAITIGGNRFSNHTHPILIRRWRDGREVPAMKVFAGDSLVYPEREFVLRRKGENLYNMGEGLGVYLMRTSLAVASAWPPLIIADQSPRVFDCGLRFTEPGNRQWVKSTRFSIADYPAIDVGYENYLVEGIVSIDVVEPPSDIIRGVNYRADFASSGVKTIFDSMTGVIYSSWVDVDSVRPESEGGRFVSPYEDDVGAPAFDPDCRIDAEYLGENEVDATTGIPTTAGEDDNITITSQVGETREFRAYGWFIFPPAYTTETVYRNFDDDGNILEEAPEEMRHPSLTDLV